MQRFSESIQGRPLGSAVAVAAGWVGLLGLDDGGNKKARIFSRPARSYSSMMLARSSSDLTDTSASRSSVGSWQRRLTATHPHISLIFSCSSEKGTERSTASTRVSPPM